MRLPIRGTLCRHMLWKILHPVAGFSLTFLVLFNLLYLQNSVELVITTSIAGGVGLIIAAGIAFSKTARCVSILSIPHLTSQQGRLILLSLVTGLLLGGPVANITTNTQEVAKIVSCVGNLSQQHALALKEAYQGAYDDITEAVRNSKEALDNLSRGLDKVLDPISDGLEAVSQSVTNVKNSISEATSMCKTQIEAAGSSCRRAISSECKLRKKRQIWNIGEKIKETFKGIGHKIENGVLGVGSKAREGACNVPWLVGSPVCDALSSVNGVCTPFNKVNEAVGKVLTKVLDSMRDFKDLFIIDISYKDSIHSKTSSSVNGTEIRENIKSEYEDLFKRIQFVIRIIQYILLGTILLIPLKAWMYLRSYLQNKDKETSEAMKKENPMIQIVMILIHFLITASICLFDYLLYYIQHVVETKGEISFEASGTMGVSLDIRSTAFQKIIDSFMHDFDVDRRHNFTTSTASCLPSPTKPSFSIVIPVAIIYVVIIGLTILGNSILKERIQIVHRFYPAKNVDVSMIS